MGNSDCDVRELTDIGLCNMKTLYSFFKRKKQTLDSAIEVLFITKILLPYVVKKKNQRETCNVICCNSACAL